MGRIKAEHERQAVNRPAWVASGTALARFPPYSTLFRGGCRWRHTFPGGIFRSREQSPITSKSLETRPKLPGTDAEPILNAHDSPGTLAGREGSGATLCPDNAVMQVTSRKNGNALFWKHRVYDWYI